MINSTQSSGHDTHATINKEDTFSRFSEAFASILLGNAVEMSYRYHMDSHIISSFNSDITHWCVTCCDRVLLVQVLLLVTKNHFFTFSGNSEAEASILRMDCRIKFDQAKIVILEINMDWELWTKFLYPSRGHYHSLVKHIKRVLSYTKAPTLFWVVQWSKIFVWY